MSSRALSVAVVLSLLSLSGAPRLARAENAADVETARAYFVEATRLGKLGRWKEARELYARSLELKPSPVTRYSLGVAQRETGHYAEALASFRAFLEEPTTPASAPFVEPARAAVTALLVKVGEVTIVVAPERAEGLSLMIDGQPAPVIVDAPRNIDPGPHEVVARAPGFQPARAWFFAKPHTQTRVSLTLTPIVNEPRPFAHGPVKKPAPDGPSRALPIALMASGGALVVAGVTLGLWGVSEADRAPTRDGSAARSARAKAIAGDVLAGTGAVTAGVGLIVLLTRGSGKKAASGVAPWSSGSVVGVEGRF